MKKNDVLFCTINSSSANDTRPTFCVYRSSRIHDIDPIYKMTRSSFNRVTRLQKSGKLTFSHMTQRIPEGYFEFSKVTALCTFWDYNPEA